MIFYGLFQLCKNLHRREKLGIRSQCLGFVLDATLPRVETALPAVFVSLCLFFCMCISVIVLLYEFRYVVR